MRLSLNAVALISDTNYLTALQQKQPTTISEEGMGDRFKKKTSSQKEGRYKRAGVEACTAERKTREYSRLKQNFQASASLLR